MKASRTRVAISGVKGRQRAITGHNGSQKSVSLKKTMSKYGMFICKLAHQACRWNFAPAEKKTFGRIDPEGQG